MSLSGLLRPDVSALRPLAPGMHSALSGDAPAGRYDAMAAGYDRLVGNPLYNRIVWRCPVAAYAKAAKYALFATPDGPLLDAGCGSLVFTEHAYRSVAPDRLVLLDRSRAMLDRAHARAPHLPIIQGDILALPFRDAVFAGTMSWGMLHLFGSASPMLAELARVTRPGGRVSLSCLVPDGRWLSDRMLGVLHRRGEIAHIATAEAVTAAFAAWFDAVTAERVGAMLFLTGSNRAPA